MAELRYYQHDAVVATYRHLREKSTNPFLEPFNEKEEEYPEDLEPISISH